MTDDSNVKAGYHSIIRRDVFPLVPKNAGRVLDLGGGIGATSATLKREGRADHIVVVDLVADNALPEVDVSVSGNLEDPQFLAALVRDHGPFDTILCLDVLEHLTDPWTVVEHLRDALADDGVIIASIPNVRCVEFIVPLVVFGRFDLKDAGIFDRTHMRWFVRDTAVQLMTPSGLVLDKMIDKILDAFRYRTLNRLTLGLFRRFLETQYLIRVRKSAD